MSWLVYKRGRIEPFRAYLALFGAFKFLKHDCGASQPRTLYINENDRLYWSWEKEPFNLFGKKFLIFLKNSHRLKKHFIKMDRVLALALNSSQLVFKTDLTKLSNQELIKKHRRLMTTVALAHFIFNTEIDAADIFLEDFVKKQVAKELKSKIHRERLEEIFSVLIKPVCPTYVNQMEIAVNRLAFKKDFSRQSAQKIYEKFWWTNLGWENMQPYSLKYFQSLIKKRAKLKTLGAQLQRARNYIKNNRRARDKYLQELNFSSAIRCWLEICDQYIFYHDKRKELQVRTTYSARLILEEIARRYRFKMNDLEWLWHHEAIGILNGQPVDFKEIKSRKQCVVALVSYKSFQSWSGMAAKKIKNRVVKESAKRIKELRGRGVAGTVVRARVKVCAGASEALLKVKRGDILVCPMTLPDYLPALRRARAIITEEGGITCHAAIIAREFNIPCVVGTKIATQILHDGDLVEVDPPRGIVRILS